MSSFSFFLFLFSLDHLIVLATREGKGRHKDSNKEAGNLNEWQVVCPSSAIFFVGPCVLNEWQDTTNFVVSSHFNPPNPQCHFVPPNHQCHFNSPNPQCHFNPPDPPCHFTPHMFLLDLGHFGTFKRPKMLIRLSQTWLNRSRGPKIK